MEYVIDIQPCYRSAPSFTSTEMWLHLQREDCSCHSLRGRSGSTHRLANRSATSTPMFKASVTPKKIFAKIVCLQKEVVDHWIIQPSCGFDDLPDDVKQTNTYCAIDIHGIHWFEGDINLHNLHRCLYNIARISTRIYVRGEEKPHHVETLLGRRIRNLETFESPTFGKLDTIFPVNSVCVTHSMEKKLYFFINSYTYILQIFTI